MYKNSVILLADDRDDDVVLIRRAFQRAKVLNPLQSVTNGEEAIAYLEGSGPYADRTRYPFPTLLLLDLKMPRKTGSMFYAGCKRSRACRR